jgi:hypothetical protein
MGVLRTGTETEPPSGEAVGPGSTRSPWPASRRRWIEVAAFALAAAALFAVYLRLSRTVPENSDEANVLLAAKDLLHGNVLLHGWYLTDVSFYTTEVPQYALLELLFGLHPDTAHIAAAMTYTLAVVLAVLVARGGFTSRAAVVRLLIAAGILLAPQLGPGVTALILTIGHIGTAVPVLLIFLLLDRAQSSSRGEPSLARGDSPSPRPPLAPRTPLGRYVPVLTGLALAWVLVADQIVLIVAVAPLAGVCALRLLEAAVRERSLSRAFATRRYELSLIVAAAAAAGLAWVAERVLRALGGYVVAPVPFTFTLHSLPGSLHSLWAVPQIFGADYRGLSGGPYYTALLHMVSLALVVLALFLLARRFFSGAALVDQVLGVAIVLNIALFILTTAGSEGPHEVADVAPFGAALAARMLTAPRPAGARAPGRLARRARAVAYGAGVVVLAGYLGGLAHDVAQPESPAAFSRVAAWLQAHHLTYGLGGYWESSIVTVQTGEQVKVRALLKATLGPDLWLAKPAWYDPTAQQANFVVLSSTPGFKNNWEPRALVAKVFGRPAHVYNFGPYTVMVWDRNILADVPR